MMKDIMVVVTRAMARRAAGAAAPQQPAVFVMPPGPVTRARARELFAEQMRVRVPAPVRFAPEPEPEPEPLAREVGRIARAPGRRLRARAAQNIARVVERADDAPAVEEPPLVAGEPQNRGEFVTYQLRANSTIADARGWITQFMAANPGMSAQILVQSTAGEWRSTAFQTDADGDAYEIYTDGYENDDTGPFEVSRVQVTVVPRGTIGLDDDDANCFFRAIGGDVLRYAALIRERMKIADDEGVDIANIDDFERINRRRLAVDVINAYGEYMRRSTIVDVPRVTLLLHDEHFTNADLVDERMKTREVGGDDARDVKPRAFVAYTTKNGVAKTYSCVRGVEEKRMFDIANMNRSDKICMFRAKDLVDDYNKTVATCNEIVSAGAPDPRQFNFFSYGLAAMAAWLRICDGLHDHLSPLPAAQQAIVSRSLHGGYVFAERGYEGPAVKCDFCSFYPRLMNSPAPLPVGPGKITNGFDQYRGRFERSKYAGWHEYPVGFFEVSVEDPTYASPLHLRKHKNHMYTSAEIWQFIHNGYKVTAYPDEQTSRNLVWDRNDCITFQNMFGQFVDKYFAAKAMGNKGIKKILNSLWGFMVQRASAKPKGLKWGEQAPEGVVKRIRSSNFDDNAIVEYRENAHEFFKEAKCCHIGALLTGMGRASAASALKAMLARGFRCVQWHTDGGVFVDVGGEVPSMKNKDLLVEQRGRCRVKHAGGKRGLEWL